MQSAAGRTGNVIRAGCAGCGGVVSGLQSPGQASTLGEGAGYNAPYHGGELPSEWCGPQFRNLY